MSKRPDYALMPCTYCGEISQCLDHIEPHCTTACGATKYLRRWAKHLVVPACSECNNLLSNHNLLTIGERAKYLSQKYRQRYKKVLTLPKWSREELMELKLNLRKKIAAEQRKKAIVQRRISNCDEMVPQSLTALDIWDNWDRAQEARFEPRT